MNKMENGTEKINRILTSLANTQEDMLALKDYIWQNLDHSSVEEVQTAASFQVKYLELLCKIYTFFETKLGKCCLKIFYTTYLSSKIYS